MAMQKQYAYFSAAIREGAKLRPQTTETYFDSLGRSCALGAGLEACFGYEDDNMAKLVGMYPYLQSVLVSCPAAGCDAGITDVTIEGLIPHLNDDHRWTREAIADWLYAVEEKLGFVTVVDTNEPVTCESRDNNITQEQASVLTLK